jgi:hypothetical protein
LTPIQLSALLTATALGDAQSRGDRCSGQTAEQFIEQSFGSSEGARAFSLFFATRAGYLWPQQQGESNSLCREARVGEVMAACPVRGKVSSQFTVLLRWNLKKTAGPIEPK